MLRCSPALLFQYNNRIRRISLSTGIVSTFAGSTLSGTGSGSGSSNGFGSNAKFETPKGMFSVNASVAYVCDTLNHRIRLLVGTTTAVTSTYVGFNQGFLDGVGTNVQLKKPVALTFDNVNSMMYVADTGNSAIRAVTPRGVVTTISGATGESGFLDGFAMDALFNEPAGIAVTSSGMLWLSDTGALREHGGGERCGGL